MTGATAHQPEAESAADPTVIVQHILEREIDCARKAVETYNAGFSPTADTLVPYAEEAEHLLSTFVGKLQLKVRGSNLEGEDVNFDGNIELSKSDSSRVALLTRLSLYLLQTRGRFTKKERDGEKKVCNIDGNLLASESFEKKGEKREFLEGSRKLHKAKSLRSLYCKDPEFSARVLQVMSPRLEEAQLSHGGELHLSLLASMPRLRRLEINFPQIPANDLGPFQWDDEPCHDTDNNISNTTRPWRFKKGPPLDGGLFSFKGWLPRHVLFPFIALHSRTLKELILKVDLPAVPGDEVWRPEYLFYCNDLPERLTDLLKRHPMESLSLLELNRHHSYREDYTSRCERQLLAVRQVVGPSVVVRCNRCP